MSVKPFDSRCKVLPTGCWEWTGSRNPFGYGRLSVDGKWVYAHRVSYEAANGPIPEGLVIDHLCRVAACINPDHLEAVTQRENMLRGVGPVAVNVQKTRCTHGHLFDSDNTYWTSVGARQCRACNVARQRRYRAQRAAT